MAKDVYALAAEEEERKRKLASKDSRKEGNQSLMSIYANPGSEQAQQAGRAMMQQSVFNGGNRQEPVVNPNAPQPSGKRISPEEQAAFEQRHRDNSMFGNFNPEPVQMYAQPGSSNTFVPANTVDLSDDEEMGNLDFSMTQGLPTQEGDSAWAAVNNENISGLQDDGSLDFDTGIDFKEANWMGDLDQIDYSMPKEPEPEEKVFVPAAPTPADGYVGDKVVTADGQVVPNITEDPNAPARAAEANGVDKSGANYIANTDLEYDPKTGIATVDAASMGLRFDTGHEYRPRDFSDRQAMLQGLITGGIAVLGAALAGGNSQDLGAAFFLAGANRFAGALNESARYKNIESLEKQGYTPQSIEEYIETGSRDALKKHEIDDWKEYPDGSGRMYRSTPDGKVQFMKGTPKWETMTVKQGWQTKQRYRNPVTGDFMRNEDGSIKEDVIDDGKTAQQNFNQKGTEARLRYGKESKGSAAEAKATAKQQAAAQKFQGQVTGYRRDILNRVSHFKGDNGWKTGGDSAWNDPKLWVTLGGGYGKFPEKLDAATALLGNNDLRNDIIKAQQVGAQMTNLGIQAARDAGASGINTVAEIERFRQSMPQVDYSSYDNMIASLQEIETYTNEFIADLESQANEIAGSQPAATPTAAPSQAEPASTAQPAQKPLYSVGNKSTSQTYTSKGGNQISFDVE